MNIFYFQLIKKIKLKDKLKNIYMVLKMHVNLYIYWICYEIKKISYIEILDN